MNDPYPRTAGTGFVAGMKLPSVRACMAYLVTAQHVIDHIRAKSCDNKVLLRVDVQGDTSEFIETHVDEWLTHPADETVDVAVRPFAMKEAGPPMPIENGIWGMHPNYLATSDVIKAEGIGPGDEVFIVGLFRSHTGKVRNIPIIRIGNIAATPGERVQTKWREHAIEAYLIEARSIGGLSGSPVFVHLGPVLPRPERPTFARQPGGPHYLLGLVHGHWDLVLPDADAAAEDGLERIVVNAGIAMVVPVWKILEVLDQPRLTAVREDYARHLTPEDVARLNAATFGPDELRAPP
jgi:hypothetical protein